MKLLKLALTFLCIMHSDAYAQEIVSLNVEGVKYLSFQNIEGDKVPRFVKWGKPQLQSGAKVTWTLLDRVFFDKRFLNCHSMRPLFEVLEKSKVSLETFRQEVEIALKRWTLIADINFEYEVNAEKADITIGTDGNPSGWAWAGMIASEIKENNVQVIAKARICLNSSRIWPALPAPDHYSIQRVIDHEIGHVVFGLDHPANSSEPAIMSYRNFPDVRANESERRAARFLYGPSKLTPPS